MLMLVVVIALAARDAVGEADPKLKPCPAPSEQYEATIAFVREQGFTQEDADALWQALQRAPQPAWGQGQSACPREDFVWAVPLLIQILGEWQLPLAPMAEDAPLSKARLYLWLGFLGHEEGVEHLLERARTTLQKGVQSPEQASCLRELLLALGYSRNDAGLDFLFDVQSDSYWVGPGAPSICIPAIDGGASAEEIAEGYRNSLMGSAVLAIAWSGTGRALRAFAEGKAINSLFADEMDYFFGLCARTSIGIQGFPENVGKALEPNEERQLEAVYREYGKRYVPKEVREETHRHWVKPTGDE